MGVPRGFQAPAGSAHERPSDLPGGPSARGDPRCLPRRTPCYWRATLRYGDARCFVGVVRDVKGAGRLPFDLAARDADSGSIMLWHANSGLPRTWGSRGSLVRSRALMSLRRSEGPVQCGGRTHGSREAEPLALLGG